MKKIHSGFLQSIINTARGIVPPGYIYFCKLSNNPGVYFIKQKFKKNAAESNLANLLIKTFPIAILIFSQVTVWSQTTVTYTQQTANYYSTLTSGATFTDNGVAEVTQTARTAAPLQSVGWRKLRTDGNGGGSLRALQVGDEFTIQYYGYRAYGRIGVALLSSPSSTASWADRENNYALSVNLDGPLYAGVGVWGNFYIKYDNGSGGVATTAAGFGGSTTGYDYTFKFRLTAPDRMNVTVTSSNGPQTFTAYDLLLRNSGPITDYTIFFEDDYNGSVNTNIYWKQTTNIINTGSLPIGQSNNTFTISSVINNGLDANSISSNLLNNALTKSGTGTLTLSGANTYQGITSVTNGTLSTSSLADGGSASGIGQSTNSATNLLLGNGTTFNYTGTAVSSDRLFTINGIAAGQGASFNASGSGALNLTNTGNIAYGTNNQTRALTLSGTNSGNNTLASLIANNGSGAVSVTKTGTGMWLLTGTNTYTGVTSINNGILSISSLTNGGVASPIGQATNAAANLVLGGGTLQYTGATTSTDRAFTLTAATTSSIDISTGSTILTISGSAANTSGALTKAGAGTLLLSGNNLFTGGVNVNAGTLQAGSAGALNSITPNAVAMGGGTLSLNGFNTTISSLSGASGTVNNTNSTPAVLTVNTTGTTTYSGIITDGAGGGAFGLTKSGTGTLTLSGSNSYTGNTILTGGAITINTAASLSANSNLKFNGGNLSIGTVGSSAVLNGGTINFQNNTSIDLGAGASTFSLNFASSSAEVWNGAATITIYNWTPSAGKIINIAGAGLTAGQLAKINFDNYGVGAKFVGNEIRPALLFITNGMGGGNFSNASSWYLNDKPSFNDGTESIFVQGTDVLNVDVSPLNFLRVQVAGNLAMSNNTINVFATGDFRLSGTVTMTSASVINMNTGISLIAQSATANFSPAGTLNFQGAFTITSNLPNAVLLPNVNLNASVDFGQNSTIQNGSSLNMQSGGFINTNPPYYATGSTLFYNTGGTYNRSTEWSATSGRGYPYNVTVGNGSSATSLNLNNSSTLQMGGNLFIAVMSSLTMNDNVTPYNLKVLKDVTISGTLTLGNLVVGTPQYIGDLEVGGNITRNAGGTFNPNKRAVIFNGSSTQTVDGGGSSLTFAYFIVANTGPNNVQFINATDVLIDGGIGGHPLQLLNGNLDLNGRTMSFRSYTYTFVNDVKIDGTSGNLNRQIISSGGSATFNFTNPDNNQRTTTVSRNSGLLSTLSFSSDIVVNILAGSTGRSGVNFGSGGKTTIYGTLQINPNTFVDTDPPIYDPASKLIYQTNGSYDRTAEWISNTSGAAGYPGNVFIQGGTTLNFLNNTNFDAGCAGNLNIGNTSASGNGTLVLSNYLNPYDIYVGGDVIIGGAIASGTLTLSDNTGSDIYIGGSWNRNTTGTINFGAGLGRAVFLNGSNNGIITANGAGQKFPFLYLVKSNTGATVTLKDSVAISDEIGFTQGTFDLENKNLVILSTASKTARVGQSNAATTIFPYSGAGRFIIERNVEALRSWRLLTAPINSSQTIQNAWMEGATPSTTIPLFNSDPAPGYGTHISGPSPATYGFDQTPQNNYSIKYYDGTSKSWVGTGINTTTTDIISHQGWMLFIRGGRDYPISTTTVGTTPQTTTLRTMGKINIGTMPVINPSGFTVVGNPYASAVNFSNVTKSATGDIYYIWDPKITSGTTSTTVGGWITCTRSSGTTYLASPTPVSSTIDLTTGRIESGAAIMVNATNITSMNFKEADKSSLNALVFRPLFPEKVKSLRANFYVKNSDGTLALFDGVMNLFDKSYNNELDGADAVKLTNFAENFSISKKGGMLAIEKRNLLTAGDTIFYNMSQLKLRNYTIEFVAENIAQNNLAGFLEDKYLNTLTPINMQGSTKIDFNVTNADAGSYAADRFRLVFKRSVRHVHLKADLTDENITVKWNVEDEANIRKFEIEKSEDAVNFISTGIEVSVSNKTSIILTHTWIDKNPAPGMHYYRIKITDNNGVDSYSDTVSMRIENKSGLFVFPNPVTNNIVHLQMHKMPQGNYSVQLVNKSGQVITGKIINHSRDSNIETISLDKTIARGNYHLKITGAGKSKIILVILF